MTAAVPELKYMPMPGPVSVPSRVTASRAVPSAAGQANEH